MKKYIRKLSYLMVLVCALGLGITTKLFAVPPLSDIAGEGYDDQDLMTNADARYLEDRTMRRDTPTEVPTWRAKERERKLRHAQKRRDKTNKRESKKRSKSTEKSETSK